MGVCVRALVGVPGAGSGGNGGVESDTPLILAFSSSGVLSRPSTVRDNMKNFMKCRWGATELALSSGLVG